MAEKRIVAGETQVTDRSSDRHRKSRALADFEIRNPEARVPQGAIEAVAAWMLAIVDDEGAAGEIPTRNGRD